MPEIGIATGQTWPLNLSTIAELRNEIHNDMEDDRRYHYFHSIDATSALFHAKFN